MGEPKRYTLTQEEIAQRQELDATFQQFMTESLADRRDLRKTLEANTKTLSDVRTALFAQNDDNEFGITGLMTNMQTVVNHVKVVCNIAKWLKWSVVSLGVLAAAVIPLKELFAWWGV